MHSLFHLVYEEMRDRLSHADENGMSRDPCVAAIETAKRLEAVFAEDSGCCLTPSECLLIWEIEKDRRSST